MKITTAGLRAIEAHALETYPDECCGVIVAGPDGRQDVIRIRNVQNEMHASDPVRYPRTARTAYAGHPADLKAALERGEAPGYVLSAFYHSHPDHEAYFSDEDLAQATPFGEPSYPDALQIVISVFGTEVRAVKAFAWSEPDAAYGECPLDRD